MNTLQLYKNNNPYPYYSSSITAYGSARSVTPVNQNLRSGYVDLQLTLDDLLEFNYLSYTRNGRTVYAWVTDVEKLGGSLLYRVNFEVDAFRTYRASINLDVQWVRRDMYETGLPDPMLSSLTATNTIERYEMSFSDAGVRTLIVQVREDASDLLIGDLNQAYKDLPVQPSPYTLYMTIYNTNTWFTSSQTPIAQLLQKLSAQAQTTNIVTMYSVPGNLVGGNSQNDSIPIRYASEDGLFSGGDTSSDSVPGFFKWSSNQLSFTKDVVSFPAISDPLNMLRGKHDVRVVIPGAGIISVPDEILFDANISLVRYVDVYSGACSYSIEAGSPLKPYDLFIRASGPPSIPILSSTMDSYLSQNQNSMMTQIIGDVAMLGGSIAGSIASGGSAAPFLLPAAAGSVSSLVNTIGNVADANRVPPSNPPAMLGAALTPHYDGQAYILVSRQDIDNDAQIHAKYGYPQNISKALNLSTITGFIQTQSCAIKATDAIPLWAIQEINQLFDGGLFFI